MIVLPRAASAALFARGPGTAKGVKMPKLLIVALVLLMPSLAHAYIGPGAGITAIGSLLALVGAVLLAVIGFVWYPIKRLRRSRAKKASAAATTSNAGTDQP